MRFLVFHKYPWHSWFSKTIHEILGCRRWFMKFLVFQDYPWNSWSPRSTYPWKSCFTGRAYGPASEPARDLISGSLGGEADSALAQSQVPFTPWTVSIKRQVRGFHSRSPSTEFRIVSLSSGQALSRSESTSSAHAQWVQGPPLRPVVEMRMRSPAPRHADECRKCGEMERALSGVREEKTNTSLLSHWVVFSFRP